MPIDRPNDAHHGLNRREALATSAASIVAFATGTVGATFSISTVALAQEGQSHSEEAPSGVEALHQ